MNPNAPPPAISVLMAVYNGAGFLRPAIDSILTQTYRDFEFIIIDDGSADDTPRICDQYARQDARIRFISRPNKGLTFTLNQGLGLARGEFLARMDADDISLPNRFEKQSAFLLQNPTCVLVGSAVLLMDPDGMPIRQTCTEQTHEQIDHAHLHCGWPVVHPAVMMRTAAVRKIGGYRDQYNTLEDLDLFLRLAEVGTLANLPEVLLHYRQHFGSVTHRKAEQQSRLRQAIFDETAKRRGLAEAPKAPPPAADEPRWERHRSWGWSALKAGNVATARKHAFITVRGAPFHRYSWHLLACALRGH